MDRYITQETHGDGTGEDSKHGLKTGQEGDGTGPSHEQALLSCWSGLNDPTKPIGSFIFLVTTGVG